MDFAVLVIVTVRECRPVKTMCKSNGSRVTNRSILLIRAVQIQDQLSVGLDIGAARLRDEVSDALYSSGP